MGTPIQWLSCLAHWFFCFFKFLEHACPFCGVKRYPYFGLLVTSALGFKARVDSLACFHACRLFLRFISAATPANLLMASMAVCRVPYMLSSAEVGHSATATGLNWLSCKELYVLNQAVTIPVKSVRTGHQRIAPPVTPDDTLIAASAWVSKTTLWCVHTARERELELHG